MTTPEPDRNITGFSRPLKQVTSTTVRVPVELWTQVRFYSIRVGATAAEVTQAALIEYLERAGYPYHAEDGQKP